MKPPSADYYIDKLQLQEHLEGGYYRELYRSEEILPKHLLPRRYEEDRCVATSIYFLLKSEQISHFHRLKSDETWYFHTGSPLWIHILTEDGYYQKILLGEQSDEKLSFQYTISRNNWFGATVHESSSFSLVSCSVSPGFDFHDFEMADKQDLITRFPNFAQLIEKMTI